MKFFRVFRPAVFLFTVAVLLNCSKKSTGPSGPTAPTAYGTWALTLIKTITGTDTTNTPVPADSSSRYVQVSGTTVMLYAYDQSLPMGPGPQVWIGTYDAGQNRLVFTQDAFAVTLNTASMILVADSDNNVLYTFTRYAGTVPPDHWPVYNLTVEDDLYEPDDNAGTATALVSGAAAQTHTLDNTDQDWFSLQLTGGYIHVITLSVDVWEIDFGFYDNSGMPLDPDALGDWDDDDNTLTLRAYSSQTVYMRLRSQTGMVYTISFRSSPVNPSPYSGTWYVSEQYVLRRENGNEMVQETTFTVETTPMIAVFHSYSIVMHQYWDGEYQVDSVGIVYVNSTTMIIGGDTVTFIQSGGTIRISMVEDQGTEYYEQRITLLPYSGSVPPVAWTTGPAIPSSAVPLAVNATAVNSSLSPGEEEWYYFTAMAGNTYVAETGGDLDTYMYLYVANGNNLTLVTSDDDGGMDMNARISFTATAGGVYYIRIRGFDSSETGPYSMSLTGGGILKSAGIPGTGTQKPSKKVSLLFKRR